MNKGYQVTQTLTAATACDWSLEPCCDGCASGLGPCYGPGYQTVCLTHRGKATDVYDLRVPSPPIHWSTTGRHQCPSEGVNEVRCGRPAGHTGRHAAYGTFQALLVWSDCAEVAARV